VGSAASTWSRESWASAGQRLYAPSVKRSPSAPRPAGAGRFLLPGVVIAAGVSIFVALAVYRPDDPRADDEPVAEGASAADPSPAPETGPGRRSATRLARSLPQFIQATSPGGGAGGALHADLTDQGSQQAAQSMFDEQKRDPGWAPRMEQHLVQRLHPAALTRLGLPGLDLRLVALECRSFGCQVVVDWSPDGASARPPAPPFSLARGPVRYLHDRAGPLAAAVMRHSRQQRPDRQIRETFLLFYRDDLREPTAWPER
jgi:hypothetical protein